MDGSHILIWNTHTNILSTNNKFNSHTTPIIQYKKCNLWQKKHKPYTEQETKKANQPLQESREHYGFTKLS
jgi:hypothetical protein